MSRRQPGGRRPGRRKSGGRDAAQREPKAREPDGPQSGGREAGRREPDGPQSEWRDAGRREPTGRRPGRRGSSLGVHLVFLALVFGVAVLVAELAGAANLGVALGVGQIAFAIALVYLLLKR